MARGLTPLGHARVYRDPRNGELVVDADTLRRTSFAGEEPDDDFGDEDFEGDDDFGEEDDEQVGADSDIEGDIEGDEVGRQRRRRKKNRKGQRGRSQHTPRPQHGRKQTVQHNNASWGMTAVSGTTALTAAGAASVTIRLQHHFKAKDITFEGSGSGAKVTSIFFGDRAVWSNSAGIPVSVFGSSSFMRNLLKGQSMHAGLDIVVNGALKEAGDFAVTILGFKPVDVHC